MWQDPKEDRTNGFFVSYFERVKEAKRPPKTAQKPAKIETKQVVDDQMEKPEAPNKKKKTDGKQNKMEEAETSEKPLDKKRKAEQAEATTPIKSEKSL